MGEVEVGKERKGVEDKSLGFTEERLEGAEKGEGVSRAPDCLLAASFPTWSPALHTHTHTHTPVGGGWISSFSFLLLPGRKWLQMLWVGHFLASHAVPRSLLIPGDRAGTSKQPGKGVSPV